MGIVVFTNWLPVGRYSNQSSLMEGCAVVFPGQGYKIVVVVLDQNLAFNAYALAVTAARKIAVVIVIDMYLAETHPGHTFFTPVGPPVVVESYLSLPRSPLPCRLAYQTGVMVSRVIGVCGIIKLAPGYCNIVGLLGRVYEAVRRIIKSAVVHPDMM